MSKKDGGINLGRFGNFELDDNIQTEGGQTEEGQTEGGQNKKKWSWKKTTIGAAIMWILSAWWGVWYLANQDWVKDREPVVKKDSKTEQLLAWAGNSDNPAQYIQDNLGINQEQLIEKIKEWLPQNYLPEWAENITFTLENRDYEYGWVLLESWWDWILKEVIDNVPSQVNKATFVVVSYTLNWKSQEKVFALLCSNWLVREIKDGTIYWVSTTLAYESSPGNRTVVMWKGNSFMGTLWVSLDEAKKMAKEYKYKAYEEWWLYIVVVPEWSEWENLPEWWKLVKN